MTARRLRQYCALLTALFCVPAPRSFADDEIHFSTDIRPIFAEYCLQCHGPDEANREAGLRLDVEETGLDSAVVPGQPDASEIIRRMTEQDADLRMPPPEMENQPTSDEIDLVRRWISAGAVFEGHWAYQPIRRPTVPEPETPALTDIDRFIIAELEKQSLQLSPPLERHQLLRRASYDLLGLPPTAEEVQAFISDPSPDAYAQAIDRMLDSPRYGERWGRHWLDVARYADTHGGSAIGFTKFPFSYTYRDYVINAINDGLPFDQFINQQIAADQMGLDENDPALAGLGFLTVGMQFRSIHDLIDDQIDVVTRGLMGMTVACARCHDHKFDDIPTTDYYAMYATLASSSKPDQLPIIGTPPPSPTFDQYQQQLQHRKSIHQNMARDQASVMRGRLRNQVGLYLTELAKGTPEQDVSAAFLSYRTDDVRPIVLNRWRDYLNELSDTDPVFGPWKQTFDAAPETFAEKLQSLLESMKAENGDPAAFANPQSLGIEGPKWNPRMIEWLEKAKPKSLIELADAYGNLFANVHQTWLQSLLNASMEAAPGAEIITDEDPRHAEINSSINAQLRAHLFAENSPTAMPDSLATTMLNRTVSDTLNGKAGTIHDLHLNSPGSPPRAMVLAESDDPPEFKVFLRGNPLSRGETVQPHFLTAITSPEPTEFKVGQRRLDLARAITAPENPLTRRVIVNWIWKNHFGTGLVRTPDDFGTRGTPPTNPKLLDYLASVFAEDGWSIKKMHRRIMLSAVYQQSASEDSNARIVDPDNELYWRMPRKRLDMESMRDAMLAASGELDTSTIGGRPFDFEAQPVVPRRSVYGFINRDILSELATTFDGADPTSCTVKRPDTSVPQQTLYSLNSSFVQDRADAIAKLAIAAEETDQDRIRWMYRRLFSRDPDPSELELTTKYLQTANDRWSQLAHVLLASNEFMFVD